MSPNESESYWQAFIAILVLAPALAGGAGWILNNSLGKGIQENKVAIEEVKTEIKEVKAEVRVSFDKIEHLIRFESKKSDAHQRATAVERRELRDHIAKLTTDQAVLEEQISQITSGR